MSSKESLPAILGSTSREHGAAGRGDARVEPALEWSRRLIGPDAEPGSDPASSTYILALMKHLVVPLLCFVCKTGVDRGFPRVVLTGLLPFAAPGAAPSERSAGGPTGPGAAIVRPRQPDRLTSSPATSASNWTSAPGDPSTSFRSSLGPTGFVGAPEQAVVDYIRSIFTDRPKPDLIVTIAGPAAVFARKHRQQLFPDTPLLFASVDQRYLRDAPLGENETAVAVDNDFPRTRRRHPAAAAPDQAGVHGDGVRSSSAQFWRRELEEQFRRFHDRLTFVWSDDLSLPEILRRCASLPRQLGDLLSSPSARTRRGRRMRTSEWSPTFTPRRMRPCLRRTACSLAPASSADR